MKIINIKTTDIKPYDKNPRKNDGAVDLVANSIKEFGFKVPIIVDKNNIIVAGHTRHKAAKKLGLKEVPVIVADDLTDEQIKAFRLADNKVGEIAEWDFNLLGEELDELLLFDIDMADFGFTDNIYQEDDVVEENPYTQKVDVPQYQVTGAEPKIEELVNSTDVSKFIERINQSSVSKENKEFLIKAAQRFLQFNYTNIAEYYAHQDKEMQELMEMLALVIIDYEDAIKNGFVEIREEINKIIKLEQENEE